MPGVEGAVHYIGFFHLKTDYFLAVRRLGHYGYDSDADLSVVSSF
tara:strand:+ start:467 stop:601 length:135 start_codon:yes stop_codon:yes gene_type:complete